MLRFSIGSWGPSRLLAGFCARAGPRGPQVQAMPIMPRPALIPRFFSLPHSRDRYTQSSQTVDGFPMAPLTIESAVSLNDGTSIPILGLGAYASSTCEQACLTSFEESYRHIDTAQFYENEGEVGVYFAFRPPRDAAFSTEPRTP